MGIHNDKIRRYLVACNDEQLRQPCKNECTNIYEFRTEEELYQTVEEFAYVTYNHVRPHSYNDYRTPYQTRMTA